MERKEKIRKELQRKYNYFIQCYETLPRTLEADLLCTGGVKLHISVESLCQDLDLDFLTEIEEISNIIFNE